jgi:hypothetical protein
VAHKKHRADHAKKSNAQNPSASSTKEKDNPDTPENKSTKEVGPSEKGFGNMTRFESIMAILALLGLVIAGLTGAILWHQLKEMRVDQRAWMGISTGAIAFNRDQADKTTVTVPVTFTNTGKTPARHFFSNIVIEKVQNGQSPQLLYENVPRATDSAGIMPPNAPQTMAVTMFDRDPTDATGNKTITRLLIPIEYQELVDGKAYMAVYAYTTYEDIFGDRHWSKYCVFATVPPRVVTVTAKACSDYNDVDDN